MDTTRLHASLALARTRPCGIVGVGSSTMQGYLQTDPEKRWFSRLIRRWQGEYGGTDTPQYSSTADFAVRGAAGVHGYNAGEASMTSASYLWSTEVAKICALGPEIVIHMVCANDLQNGIDPQTTKTNLLTKLGMFTGGPMLHVYVHQHKRYNLSTFPYYWSDYLTKLREIEQVRSNVLVVDLASSFETSLEIPSTDPYKLMLSDKTHLNSDGHAVMADLVYRALS